MKIQIKQLEPNPYRDMDHYPISEEKVQRLIASINQTGFWDNIPVRKHGDTYQISYGHHRLMALRRVMKPTDEIDAPVKPIGDATMLQMMANENMDEWKTSPGVIDETVRVTQTFLREHPEEKKKLLAARRVTITGAPLIALFLGWPERRVSDSLDRLGLMENEDVQKKKGVVLDADAVHGMPTDFAARKYTAAVKTFKPTKEQQKRAAAIIAKNQDFSETGIRSAITEQIYRKPKPEHQDFKLIELQEEIKAAEKLSRDLSSKLLTLIRFREEIKDQVYRAEIRALATEFNVLIQALKSFIGGKNNVKQLEG